MELYMVENGLPEKDGHYLVLAPRSFPKNSRFLVAEYVSEWEQFYSESSDAPLDDVTHWAHLPCDPT